jgi:O-antigen/teichoic acid export membrane protein
MAKLYARADAAGLRRLYADAAHLTSGISGLCGGFVLVAAEPVIGIWTRGQVAYDPGLIATFIATIALTAPAQVPFNLFQHINRPRILVIANLGYAIGTLVFCFLLVGRLSAPGAAIATGLAEVLFVGVLLPYGASNLVAIPILIYFRDCSRVIGVAFALGCGTAWAIFSLVTVHGLFGFLLAGGLWGAIVTIPAFYLLLTPQMQAYVLRYLSARRRSRPDEQVDPR